MGTALKVLREFLEKIGFEIDKKTASSLLLLILILIFIPVGLFLIKSRQVFWPQAAGELIQLGEGGCIRVNKDKKKAVDCPEVPLKLTNPFFGVNAPSPGPSQSVPSLKSIRQTDPSRFDDDLKTLRDSGGGVLYIPAGNYTLNKGFTIYSNTTLLGDGRDQTILNLPSGADSKVISSSGDGENKKIVIRDLTINGPGISGPKDDCCYGIRLRNVKESFIINVKVGGFSQDGIYLGQVNNKGVDNIRITNCLVSGNGRNGISLVHGAGNVIDNCEISNNSLREKVSGIDLEPDGSLNVSNNVIMDNNIRNNKNNGIQILQNPHDPGGIVNGNFVCDNSFSGNGGTNFDDNGTNTKTSGCSIPTNLANLPAPPPKPQSKINFENHFTGVFSNFVRSASALTDEECSGDGCSENNSDEGDDSVEKDFLADTDGDGVGDSDGCSSDEQCGGGYCDKHGSTDGKGVCKSQGRLPNKRSGSADNEDKNIVSSKNKKTASKEGKRCKKTSNCKNPELICSNNVCISKDIPRILPPNAESFKAPLVAEGSPGSLVVTGFGKVRYRLAESEAGLAQAEWKDLALLQKNNTFLEILNLFNIDVFAKDSDDIFLFSQTQTQSPSPSPSSLPLFNAGPPFINTTFNLKSSSLGAKQIWVEFIHPNGVRKVDNVNFNLVEKPPRILGLSCNLDISKENLKINLEGERFGSSAGTIESVSPSLKPEILNWDKNRASAFLKKPNIPVNEGQGFKIKLVRSDGFESGIVTCSVDKSLISLGARVFCREPGKFDTNDVEVDLFYNPVNGESTQEIKKVSEKATINADGEIAGLKTKLQSGKNYGMSIKAPSSLRKTVTFIAREGTTGIAEEEGNPFILPIGDIAPPINPDGAINTLDRSELIRQWRILGSGNIKQAGDFNRDSRVNSIDWACMSYDFGKEDDPFPSSLPEDPTGLLQRVDEENVTPDKSPTPRPSPSRDTEDLAKLDIGGKIFLDTNRNKVADIGEAIISEGLGIVKLLQVPEEHVTGTPLTNEELEESKTLIQVINNLPGANYDISVFVDNESSNKFSLLATANSGSLAGTVDFELPSPLTDSNQVINIPVSTVTR